MPNRGPFSPEQDTILSLCFCLNLSQMARFFSRHVSSLRRSQIMVRRLRAMRVRLARERRFNRRAKRLLAALQLQIEAAKVEMQNWRIGGLNEPTFLYNAPADQWVNDRLVELENDPLMRNAFERLNAQNLDGRDIINVEQAQPARDGDASGDRRE